MGKIGILTFHYSIILEAYCNVTLYINFEIKGYEQEVINYIHSNYKKQSILRNIGIRKIFSNQKW